MSETRLLNVQELSMLIGSSIQTIGSWYRWKDINPDHELAKLIPDYTRIGNRRTRYWKQSDVWKLLEFKQKLPQGRGGKGLKNYNITPKTGSVAGCCIVGEEDDVMVIENGGT